MAKRDRYSRWQRLPPVFRSGAHKIPGAADELQRIIVYLKGSLLDEADAQADRAGAPTIQEYCALLLTRAIEIERIKQHVAEIEARRGPLEGLSEISADIEYLAEWQRRFDSREIKVVSSRPPPESTENGNPELTVPVEVRDTHALPEIPRALLENTDAPDLDPPANDDGQDVEPMEPPAIRIMRDRFQDEPVIKEPERIVPEVLDRTAIEIVFAHVGPGDLDPDGFLPSLRRGEAVSPRKVSELIEALGRVEADHRGATLLDRGLGYALYRLALEAQVLITEVWPGLFDDRAIESVRAIQESVERILAGDEIPRDAAGTAECRENNR